MALSLGSATQISSPDRERNDKLYALHRPHSRVIIPRMELDRDAVRAFMVKHDIKLAAMARHAGIPYATLDAVMRGRAPSQRTVDRVVVAMGFVPMPKLPRHGLAILEGWGTHTSDEIGRRCGVSGSTIRRTAKRMGLSEAGKVGEYG